MTTFLLPCECSADIAVTAGQAGGTVSCPRCGRHQAVPKLRDLGRLRRTDVAAGGAAVAWRPAQAVALLGTIIAAAAMLAALWLSPRSSAAVDERALRAAVLAADPMAVYRVWGEVLSKVTVRRPPSDEELALLREARFADGIRSVLFVVGAGGAVAAAIAALALVSTSRPSSSPVSTTGQGEARP